MVLACLAANTGCEQCEQADGSWCTGNGVTSCEYGRATISFCCIEGCQEVEVDGAPRAVCSPSAKPDPRCADAAPIDNICVDGVALHCDHGFASGGRACANACVSAEPGVAMCALAETPDPRCGPQRSTRCSGNSILECLHGYAISELRCEAPFDTCATDLDNLGGPHPRCATASTNPACADDAPARCNGLDILGCAEGRRTFEHCTHSCYENPADSMFPEAFCEGPACSYD